MQHVENDDAIVLDDDADLLAFIAGDADAVSPPATADNDSAIHPPGAGTSLYATTALSPSGHGGASPTTAFTVTQSKRQKDDDQLDDADRRRKAPRTELFTEPRTKIRVSQGTVWLDQLHVLVAQYTYCALGSLADGLRLQSQRGSSTLPCCTIAVVTSKSDARVASGKSTNPYGLVRLWSMHGPSGQGNEEGSLLVCDAAFREQYGRTDVGSVMFLCKLELLPPRPQHGQLAASVSPTFRCTDSAAMRILGHAADLKPCQSVNRSNGEQCKRLVNVAECAFCSYHVGDLKKALTKAVSDSAHGVVAKRRDPVGGGASTVPMVFRPTVGGASTQGRTMITLGGCPSIAASAATSEGPIAGMQQYRTARGSSSNSNNTRDGQPQARAFPLPVPTTPRRTEGGGMGVPAAMMSSTPTTSNRAMPKQGETFIATRGNAVVNVSCRNVQQEGSMMVAGGAYAGVVRGKMEVTGVDRSVVGGTRLSTAALAVTHRGRDVLAAAINATDEQHRSALLYEALSGVGGTKPLPTAEPGMGGLATRPKTGPTPKAAVVLPTAAAAATVGRSARTTAAVGATEATSVPRARSQFAPLTGASRLDEDMGPQPTAHRGHPQAVNGQASAAAMIGRSLMARQGSGVASVGNNNERTTTKPNAGTALSLMGRAADAVSSRNDALRVDAERDRLAASAKRLLEVDRALSALDQIHERPVRAIHCKTCRRYSYSKPQDCVAKHHVLVQEQTVQRYLECEHCRHKVTVLGDGNAALVLPSCPRCKRTASWERSSAAPAHFTMRQPINLRDENDVE